MFPSPMCEFNAQQLLTPFPPSFKDHFTLQIHGEKYPILKWHNTKKMWNYFNSNENFSRKLVTQTCKEIRMEENASLCCDYLNLYSDK